MNSFFSWYRIADIHPNSVQGVLQCKNLWCIYWGFCLVLGLYRVSNPDNVLRIARWTKNINLCLGYENLSQHWKKKHTHMPLNKSIHLRKSHFTSSRTQEHHSCCTTFTVRYYLSFRVCHQCNGWNPQPSQGSFVLLQVCGSTSTPLKHWSSWKVGWEESRKQTVLVIPAGKMAPLKRHPCSCCNLH